jgi:hypothetical protein
MADSDIIVSMHLVIPFISKVQIPQLTGTPTASLMDSTLGVFCLGIIGI